MGEYANNATWQAFVQGLNLAKNRPTSLIWTEYTHWTIQVTDWAIDNYSGIYIYCATNV